MKHGDAVRVTSGPLTGMVGTILGEPNWNDRLNVHSIEGGYDMVTDFDEDELELIQ